MWALNGGNITEIGASILCHWLASCGLPTAADFMLKSLGRLVTNPVLSTNLRVQGSFSQRAAASIQIQESSFYTNPVRSLHPQIRSLPGRRMSGRLAKDFTRFFYRETRCKLRFQYISPIVYNSKAALRKMWLGHFTLGNGAYYIWKRWNLHWEDILYWE